MGFCQSKNIFGIGAIKRGMDVLTQGVFHGVVESLYVGRTFIEKHGGRLWAESEGHGHGSEFIFELPISRDSV